MKVNKKKWTQTHPLMKNLKLFFSFWPLLVSLTCNSQNAATIFANDPVVNKHKKALSAELETKGLRLGAPVFVRIFKEAEGYDYGCLEMWVQPQRTDTFCLFKKYPVCYFSGGPGTKTKQGDAKTPEGFYYVTEKRLNRYSSYHRAFNIGYPNKYERLKGYTGSYIMVHGNCCSIGCVAMGDDNIEEIWTTVVAALAEGQSFFRLHILPFEITESNISRYSDYPDADFLEELKKGYDYFEQKHFPPDVNAKRKRKAVRYIFK